MKNNKNYCKFVSQVKSSQVKSSAKIVSLIALFILLFSISCKPKQEPEKYSKSELIGTWENSASYAAVYIASDGGLIQYRNWNAIIGKVADTFDSYPYTIKLSGTNSNGANKDYVGTVTFHSSTNLYFYYNFNGDEIKINFSKTVPNKLMVDGQEVNKKGVCSWANW